MQRRMFVGGLGALAAGSIGAVAYSSATVARDVTIEVDADDAAIIALNPNSTAAQIDGDELVVSLSGNGLNVNGQFTFGDPSTLDSSPRDYLFSITNNAGGSRDFELTDDASELDFSVYDAAGTEQTGTFGVGDGETVYVVLDVDTSGLSGGDTLAGQLTVTAN